MNKLTVTNQIDRIKNLVLKGVDNPITRRMYDTGISIFLSWYKGSGYTSLNKSVFNEYKVHLVNLGYAPSTVNLRLSTVRRLITEMVDNQLLDSNLGESIKRVKSVSGDGKRIGNWLDKRDANNLLREPDITTKKGLRDRAILAVGLGAGLRRAEIQSLKVEDIQQRDGRWVIVDIVGKRNRVRSVPIDSWVYLAIQEWLEISGIESGLIFRSLKKSGNIMGESMSTTGIYKVIKGYSNISPHDLRRTFAKLAHKGTCPIEQIQLSLGHASIKTTESYIGVDQDFTHAPSDYLKLRLQ